LKNKGLVAEGKWTCILNWGRGRLTSCKIDGNAFSGKVEGCRNMQNTVIVNQIITKIMLKSMFLYLWWIYLWWLTCQQQSELINNRCKEKNLS
jgi:hypothetical protein